MRKTSNTQDVAWGWGILHSKELQNFLSPPSIGDQIKEDETELVAHNSGREYKPNSSWKTEQYRSFDTPMFRWEDSTKIDAQRYRQWQCDTDSACIAHGPETSTCEHFNVPSDYVNLHQLGKY
jgi:hypothetical protein